MKFRIIYIAVFILVLFNLILLNLPLTNILGYEFSIANSLFITMISGLFAIKSLNKIKEKSKDSNKAFIKKLLEANVLFLCIPLIMSLITAFFIQNCSIIEGLLFYILLAFPAVIIGTALGILSKFLVNRFPVTIFLLMYLLILSIPIAEIYFNPQVYFYNPIIGYFSGTIYDESIPIDIKLVSYRLLNIIYFSFILTILYKLIFDLRVNRNYKYLLLSIVLFLPIIFFSLSDVFGFTTSTSRMENELSGKLETKNFLIHFDTAIDKRKIENIVLHHEYYFEKINQYFQTKPGEKILSFLFLNSKQKKNLLGSANADISKPWLKHIYINYDNYEKTLEHEIAHAISGSFGATIFKIGGFFNPALTEGIATAVENNYDDNTIHFMAALAYKYNYRYPVEYLFKGLNFFGQVSSLSYIYSGSFVKYLIDMYGIEQFKRFYSGSDFLSVYEKDISETASEYYSYINNYQVIATKEKANYYFGRPTIFKKVCARFLANQLEKAWQLLNAGNYKESTILFKNLYDYSASYPALLGYVNCIKENEEYIHALKILNENLSKFSGTAYFYNLEFLKGDLLIYNRKFTEADSVFNNITVQNPSANLYYLSLLRQRLLNFQDTSITFSYLNGSVFDKYKILNALNQDSIFYPSTPVMINLSDELNEKYKDIIKRFDNISVTDFMSSYATFELSVYAINNMDYLKAKELALKSLNYNTDVNFQQILIDNLKRADWLYTFGEISNFEQTTD